MAIKVLPGNLVWWTGDSHGDKDPNESQKSGLLLWEKSMKAHLGRRESLDEKVIHIRGYPNPPSHSQESHYRPKGLRKHSKAMTGPKGKQEA